MKGSNYKLLYKPNRCVWLPSSVGKPNKVKKYSLTKVGVESVRCLENKGTFFISCTCLEAGFKFPIMIVFIFL